MNPASSTRFATGIGFFGCLLGVLCLPPIAGVLFTIEPLYPEDRLALWLFGAALLVVFGCLLRTRRPARTRLALLLLPLALLITAELVARCAMRLLPITEQTRLMQLAHRTYQRDFSFQAHPFLQFTGRPDRSLQGKDALGNLTPFNDYGFLGEVFDPIKPPETLRVACLGGSTTERGYPARLQRVLQERIGPQWHAEAMNFGMGWYSSAHIVVNLVLNVVGLSPDYAVFHEAWNDERARNLDEPVRTDYANAFQAFEYPSFPDALLIRGSVIYRWLEDRWFGELDWTFLGPGAIKPRPYKMDRPYGDVTELVPYYHNVHTFVDVALGRGIVPVLTTQPHTSDANVQAFGITIHIDQCNEVMRGIVQQYGDKVLFVDAAKLMTWKNELYVDVGHTTVEGEELLATTIGEAILAHWHAHGH